MGIIYKLTSPSGKIYIGQTTRTLEARYREHCCGYEKSIISSAIKKYGSDNIIREIIYECNNNELDENEIKYIKHYSSLEPNGYNIKTGGSSGNK